MGNVAPVVNSAAPFVLVTKAARISTITRVHERDDFLGASGLNPALKCEQSEGTEFGGADGTQSPPANRAIPRHGRVGDPPKFIHHQWASETRQNIANRPKGRFMHEFENPIRHPGSLDPARSLGCRRPAGDWQYSGSSVRNRRQAKNLPWKMKELIQKEHLGQGARPLRRQVGVPLAGSVGAHGDTGHSTGRKRTEKNEPLQKRTSLGETKGFARYMIVGGADDAPRLVLDEGGAGMDDRPNLGALDPRSRRGEQSCSGPNEDPIPAPFDRIRKSFGKFEGLPLVSALNSDENKIVRLFVNPQGEAYGELGVAIHH